MYSGTAVEVLNEAEVVPYIPHCIYEVTIPYNLKPKLDNIFLNEQFEVVDEAYTDMVTVQIKLLREKVERLNDIITEISSGQITPILKTDDIMCCWFSDFSV